MKIQKKFITILFLVLLLPFFTIGCLDFAQSRQYYDEKPLKTTYNGGRRITIKMQGIPINQAENVVENILKQINNNADNNGGK